VNRHFHLTPQAHHQAGLEPAAESAQGRKFHVPFRGSQSVPVTPTATTGHTDVLNAPAAESAKNGAKNYNQINSQNSLICDPRLAPPLNLVGGGSYRFPGCRSAERRRRIAATVDIEIGILDGEPIVSSSGVCRLRVSSRAPAMTVHRATNPHKSAMCSAFLEALERRVTRDPNGRIVLPTGIADAVEIAQVLRGINRVRREDRRREGGRR
jgi:hypothetical protein